MKKAIACFLLIFVLLATGCNDAPQTEASASGTQSQKATSSTTKGTADEQKNELPDAQQQNKPTEQPSQKAHFYSVSYVIGSISGAGGKDMSNAQRFRSEGYIRLDEIEAISVPMGYALTWFAYDEDKVYLGNGSNTYPTLPTGGVWLPEGRDVTAEDIWDWNINSVYVRFAIKRADGKNVSQEDIEMSEVKVYVDGYPGESIYGNAKPTKIAQIANGRQDGAVYGDYLFSFNSAGECKVYSLDGYTYLSSFVLDKNEVLSPHSNSVCFGSYKYSENDEFPLLYCNVYNTYKNNRAYDGTCNVYRIWREGDVFETKLVQVIKIGFTADTSLWSSPSGDVRPYGNFAVDTDNNRLYAFTMRDDGRTTRFFSFELPRATEGVFDSTLGTLKLTLGTEDILERFDVPYSYYVQGAAYYDGRIYSLEGFTNDGTNRAAMKIVNAENKALECVIDLYGMGFKTEPEVVYVYEGDLHYIDVSGNVYKFDIENK